MKVKVTNGRVPQGKLEGLCFLHPLILAADFETESHCCVLAGLELPLWTRLALNS